MKKTRVFLDPGHGGRDPGVVANGMREADIALSVCWLLETLLKSAGLEVTISRNRDEFVAIDERVRRANAWGADLLVSIHVNGFGQPSANGTEVFVFDGDHRSARSRILASDMLTVFVREMGTRDRGVRSDVQSQHSGGLPVLRNTQMPAVLFELAFLTASEPAPDVHVLRNRRNGMAMALADGILDFLGIQAESGSEEEIMRFQKVEDVPEWAREVISWMVEKGHLRGDEKGNLNLSEDMLRTFVAHDRIGLYGKR